MLCRPGGPVVPEIRPADRTDRQTDFMPTPPDGTGTVFFRELAPGEYTAIWQGDGEHHHLYADVDGSRHEVLEWVAQCRAAKYLAFDPRRDDYVAFDGITDLPI